MILVTVTDNADIVPVTGVEIIGASNISMNEGDEQQLTAKVTPENATDKKITWSSADNTVATVDENGLVKAVGVGTTTIAAVVNGIKATVKVTVSKKPTVEIPVTSVTFAASPIEMTVGEKTFVKYSVLPENATNTETTWTSLTPAIATVDAKTGEITAVAEGKAFIVIQVGAKTATLEVNVKAKPADYVAVDGVQINKTEYTLKETETVQLSAIVTPSNATDKTLTWKSSNDSVAKVDAATGLVTAVAEGKATITVVAKNGKSATCEITVEKKATEPSTDETTTPATGDTTKPSTDQPTSTTPAGTQPTTQPATQPTVPPVTGIKMNRTTANVIVGKTKKVTVKLTPSNIVDTGVKFTSANSSIATVDANGNIKGRRPGKTVVTAMTSNGLTATVKVTVRPAQVTGLKKKSVKSTSVKISWKKQKNVTGYIIYTNVGKSNKYKYYKTTKKTNIVVKKLKKNTSYRFKVRAYKTVSGSKITGACSNAAKAKTKR